MSTLYELTNDFKTVLDMAESGEYDLETLSNTLDCIECEFEQKAEGYAKVMKMVEGDISVIDTEIKRLSDKKEALLNKNKYLKEKLKQSMVAVDKKKIKTPLFSISIQKNGGKKALDIHGEVPKEYQRIIVEPDKERIREALENGESLDFAVLQESGESLRIR